MKIGWLTLFFSPWVCKTNYLMQDSSHFGTRYPDWTAGKPRASCWKRALSVGAPVSFDNKRSGTRFVQRRAVHPSVRHELLRCPGRCVGLNSRQESLLRILVYTSWVLYFVCTATQNCTVDIHRWWQPVSCSVTYRFIDRHSPCATGKSKYLSEEAQHRLNDVLSSRIKVLSGDISFYSAAK